MPSDSQLLRNRTASASTIDTSPRSSTIFGLLAAICRFQLIEVLRSNSADQLDSRAVLAKNFFNLQRHASFVSANGGPFESVGITRVASEYVAVFSAIAEFSARIADPSRKREM